MKCRTLSLGVVGILLSCAANAQVTTITSGNWNSPDTWLGGTVPDIHSGTITIQHHVQIPSGTTLRLDDIILEDTLHVEAGATLLLQHEAGVQHPALQITTGALKVHGTLICSDSARISGTANNTLFYADAVYEHRYFNSAGEPPRATWDIHSTMAITGFTKSRSLTGALWTQSFGNVVYNCPNQERSAFIEMLGNIRDVRGDFHIKTTNGGILRLTLDRTTLTTISIGGNFIVEGNSEVWISREGNTLVRVGGDFQFRSTATASSYLTTSGKGVLEVAGNVSVTSGLLRFASEGGGTGTMRVQGDFNFPSGRLAAVAPGSGSVEYIGTHVQNVVALGTWEEPIDLVVHNSSGVSLSSGFSMQGDVVVKSNALLNLPDNTINLQGNFTAEANAKILNANSTVRFIGNRNQEINLAGDTLHTIIINKASNSRVTLTGPLYVSGAVQLQSPNTTLRSQGNLIMLSTTDDGAPDSYIDVLPVGSSVEGPVTVQRFMQGEGRIYRYISSPVANATVSMLQDDFPVTGTFDDASSGPGIARNNPSFFRYTESTKLWENYPRNGMAGDHPLEVGRGYAAFIRRANQSTTWDVTGVLNQGSIRLPVTFTNTGDVANNGWNLVGNPYAASIHWDTPGAWTKSNIENEIAVRDNVLQRFLYWDGEIGNLGSGRIAKGQAFWIQASGPDPILQIHETAKTTSTAIFHKEKSRIADYLELDIAGSTVSDQAYLRLRKGATSHFETYDVPKMVNDILNVAWIVDNIPLAIAALENLDCTVPLSLRVDFLKQQNGTIASTAIGTYSLTVKKFGLFNGAKVLLEDRYMHQSAEASEQAYTFTVTTDPASYDPFRFVLRVESISPHKAPEVIHPDVVCDASSKITLQNLSPFTRCTLELNGAYSDEVFMTDQPDHDFIIDFAGQPKDTTSVTIHISSVCHEVQYDFTLTPFVEPVITEKDGMLFSNFSSGNQWYWENILLDNATQSSYKPLRSGHYKLIVRQDSCEGFAEKEVIYQHENLQCYPNPVHDSFTLVAPTGQFLQEVIILNASGERVEKVDVPGTITFHWRVDQLPPGIYSLEISTTQGKFFSRIVKN